MRRKGAVEARDTAFGGADGCPTEDLSRLRAAHDKDPIRFVTFGDLHFSLQAPPARAEENWPEVWIEYLRQLAGVLIETGAQPLLTGDVFDVGWYDQRKKIQRCPPELINLVADNLMTCTGIPGNHDLPYHSYNDIRKSAFWSLVKMEKVDLLDPERGAMTLWHPGGGDYGWRVTGVPFGCELPPVEPQRVRGETYKDVAIVHRYVWDGDNSYPGARPEDNVFQVIKELRTKGYSIGVYGDNHKGFVTHHDGVTLVNGGAFLNRKSDEKAYKPFVCGIHHSGKVSRIYLDVIDQWRPDYVPASQVNDAAKKMRAAFIQEIKDVAETEEFDFLELLEQTAKGMTDEKDRLVRAELVRLATHAKETS